MQVNLKTAWVNKEIPLVKYDIFGGKLTKKNISVKQIRDCFVLVGDKKSGILDDKTVIKYFMQFIHYPQYKRYIVDTIRKLDNVGVI